MILDLVSFCSDPVLARVLGIIKNVLGKIQLIGPILGIIALIINLVKLIAKIRFQKSAFLTFQPANSFFLNLAYAFASKVEFRTYFFKCHLLTTDAKKHFQDVTFSFVQLV